MTKQEAEDSSNQIEGSCDARLIYLEEKLMLEAILSGSQELSHLLPDQEGLQKIEVAREVIEQISRLLASQMSHDEVCKIAAHYILRTTKMQRRLHANMQREESYRQTVKRLRERISSSQLAVVYHINRARQLPTVIRREQAMRGGFAKHRTLRLAREFIRSEWAKYRQEYLNNKSEFARDYASRISHEFVNAKGDPLKVTEKTIREVWLADTPPASKPAGLPVAG
jgi:hypothetical protein